MKIHNTQTSPTRLTWKQIPFTSQPEIHKDPQKIHNKANMKRDSSHKSTKRQKENPQTRFTTRLTSTQIHLTTNQGIHQIHNTQTRPAWKQIPFASQQEDTNRSTKEIHNKANSETDSPHKPPKEQ